VRNHIRQKIFAGDIGPGERLVQTRIAAEMDVACSVVREALMELHAAGLVEANDNRGAVVMRLNGERLMEAFEVREVFEGLVARRCCARMTLLQLRELRAMTEEIYQLHQAEQHQRGAELDAEFHRRLLQIANSQLLLRLHRTFWWLGKLAAGKEADLEGLRQRHIALLDAIASGDEDVAERVAREHVRSGRGYFEKRLAEDKDFLPEWIMTEED